MDWRIKFGPIQPRSPQLNGKEERVQRTVPEEFWAAVDPKAEDIEDQLGVWVQHYNLDRTHEALGNVAPIDRVCEWADQTPLWDEVCDAYDVDHERIRVRDDVVNG